MEDNNMKTREEFLRGIRAKVLKQYADEIMEIISDAIEHGEEEYMNTGKIMYSTEEPTNRLHERIKKYGLESLSSRIYYDMEGEVGYIICPKLEEMGWEHKSELAYDEDDKITGIHNFSVRPAQ